MPLTPTILRRTLLRAGFAAAALAAWPLARAQQGGVVRAWQGFGPGSIPEQIGRLVLNAVAERTGRTFVVEGKVGAAEKILAAYMAKAPADGQQLYLMTAVQTVHTALDKELKYDVRKDFTLIGSIVQYPFILSVGMGSKHRTLQDVLAEAKAHPDKLTYCSPGVGSTLHLAGELLCSRAGVKMRHIPYSNLNYYQDAVEGRLDLLVGAFTQTLPLVQANKLRMLAVTSQVRLPSLPDVPSVTEIVPGSDVTTWLALAGPPGLPDDQRDQLSAALREVLQNPAMKSELERRGYIVRPTTPSELRAQVAADVDKYARIAADANIKLNTP
ncbi:MAG TPA: tripartite tricarboxylate transporter substrate-binding protein [Ramlibacter sp.]|nr:tripartite tricarboxylate transporter substrate-binding protein [Ramlibacter sp.]